MKHGTNDYVVFFKRLTKKELDYLQIENLCEKKKKNIYKSSASEYVFLRRLLFFSRIHAYLPARDKEDCLRNMFETWIWGEKKSSKIREGLSAP